MEAFCPPRLFLCTVYTSATLDLLASQGNMSVMAFTSIQKLFLLGHSLLACLQQFCQLSILRSVPDHLQLCSPPQVHLVLVILLDVYIFAMHVLCNQLTWCLRFKICCSCEISWCHQEFNFDVNVNKGKSSNHKLEQTSISRFSDGRLVCYV